MWPSSTTIYGISPKAKLQLADPEQAVFSPPGDLEFEAHGLTNVRDTAAHVAGKFTLLHFTHEKKHIPSGAVKLLLAEKCAEIEKAQGFPPGKKAQKELKERIVDELLPRALRTRSVTPVLFDQENHLVWIGTTSASRLDQIVRFLIKHFDDLQLQDATWPRETALRHALQEGAYGFTVDDEVQLEYSSGKKVRFARANLGEKDVQMHKDARVAALAMTYDGRISFVMTAGAQLRRIKPLDIVKESARELKDVDRFDGEFEIMTGELSGLYKAIRGLA